MSIRFDADTDTLIRSTNLPSITAFTFMGWVYRVGVGAGTYESVFGFGDAAGEYTIFLNQGAGLQFSLGNWASEAGGSALTDATWYHMAMTCSAATGSTFLGYLDGVLNVTHTALTITGSTLQVNFGPAGTNANWANFRVGGIKIYGAVLNGTEIATEKNNWAPQRTTNLIGWWPCTEASVAACITSKSPAPTGAGYDWTTGGTLTLEADPPLAPSVIWEQEGYLWRRDDGTEATATTIGAQDTPL